MRAQPKEKAYQRAMRPPVEGTYSREHGASGERLPSGGSLDAGFLARNPLRMTSEALARGQERFDIYCATCHGVLGDGDSAVGRKLASRPPPALYGPGGFAGESGNPASSGLRREPGYYFTVITEGYGLMPSYASVLDERQRWEVVAYVEALARSQSAPLASAPTQVQRRLQELPR
jgi:mono/diheme cytochrome c family protein